jgi:hypothetical protein
MSDRNTGDSNTGHFNTGHRNTGYSNTGHRNTGDSNTGHRNTGHRNTGYSNTGHRNTGYSNTGHRNTGDSNTGHRNTGDSNTGHFNTGHFNTGNRNTGYFCTDTQKARMFNQPTDIDIDDFVFPDWFYFSLTEWVKTIEMTDEEKAQHPGHVTADGYLKQYGYKDAWRKAWDRVGDDEHRKVLDLPNFDNAIFLEITGIDVEAELSAADNTVEVTCNGKTVRIPKTSAEALGLIGGC